MPPDDPNHSASSDVDTVKLTSDEPLADDAQSVLRHLKSAAPPAATPGAFPHVPGYELLEELGKGGMGVVYKARQLSLNRVVALKMILAFGNASPGEIARFLAEAEAVAAVKHENVVLMYELGSIPTPGAHDQPYFAMEFVAGGSLAKFLAARAPLAPLDAAALIAAVGDGVQAAHDAGIVHRDLKPGNILLGVKSQQVESRKVEDGEKAGSGLYDLTTLRLSDVVPKVSDFGLAKRLAVDVTRSLAAVGTPAYMAPEQADGKAKFVGPGADVYALGALLFECLTGKPPFEGAQWSVIRQVMDVPAPSPRKYAPAVPRDLELICLKCLEKEAHHRYHSAAALADDLRKFVAGQPVSVRPIGPFVRLARWAWRHPFRAVRAAAVAATIIAIPPLLVWNQNRLDQRDADALGAQEREAAAVETARLADEARRAALRLADAQKLFAIQNKLRNRAAARPMSWTYSNRAELRNAVALAGGDLDATTELRSTAVVALLAADLKPLASAVKGFTASAAATNPKTGQVALGEYLMRVRGQVRLIDPTSGEGIRTLTFTPGFIRDPAGNPFGMPDSVRALAFSPDGKHLFLGTKSSQVMRYDLDDPRSYPAAVWKASTSPLEQLAVSPDGKTVYGLCRPEKPVFAWKADSGELLAKLEPSGEAPITSFALLPTGDVVACEAHQLRRWTADHTLVQSVPSAGAWRLAATATGALLAGDARHLDVYDRDALVPLDRFVDPGLRRSVHEEYVRTIAVNPGGAFVATASGDVDRTVKVWELASGRLVGTVAVGGTGPIAVAWSLDGKTLVATASGHLARWSFRAARAEQFACLDGHPAAAAAFGTEGRVAALTEPDGAHRVLLVGAPGGTAAATRLPDSGGNGRPGVASCPGGTLAVSPAMHGLFAWKPDAVAPVAGFAKDITWCPRFDPEGKTLWAIVASSTVQAFDPGEKKLRATWSNSVEGATLGLASLDALAVGRNVVAVGGRSGSVHLLDANTGQYAAKFPASGDPVLSVALAPDESLTVAGTQNGRLRVIRTADREELPSVAAHPGGVTAVSVSLDGTLLATGGRDRVVRLWKRTGDRFEPLFAVSDLPGPVRELQFGENNRLLVLLARERAVRVWDVNALKAQLGEFGLGW